MFLLFSSESQLWKNSSYCDRLQKLNVLQSVGRNCRTFKADSEVIDYLYMQIQKNANGSKRVMFIETSSPGNDSHCSQEPCNDSS